MTVFQFTLLRIFRNKVNVLFLTLFPIACIFFPSAEEWPLLPYGYQYFGIVLLFVGIRLATVILEDREIRIDKRLAVAPLSYAQYLSQHLLAYSIVLIAQCVFVVYGGVLTGKHLAEPHLLLTLYISFSFTSLAMAVAWISIFRTKDVSSLLYMSLVILLVILGGLLVPLQIFPDWLARIVIVLPTYWLAKGQDWIVFGENMYDFLLIHGVLWLYTIVWMIFGSTRKIY